ncbi:ATP-binding protein [Fodinicola feengrottensis]|uniref:ATP-binding protein n=1 Tax=Fodinicola feengrottensis TaxID=435914 RepID=UPI0013D3D452|nr:ATP-binding protein [Fodinicola feengrottensis]
MGRPFVGRRAETRLLRESLAAADNGESRLVMVTGEPGMGKTRLLEECALSAENAGFVVHWGRCWAGGDAPALWPWPKVIAELGQPENSADPLPRFGRFLGIVEAVRAACVERPRLLVLEDLHQADPDALMVARMLAVEAARSRLLLLASWRSTEARSAAGLAELAREGATLALKGLSVQDVGGYLTAVGLSAADAPRLRTATGGNPLFLKEMRRARPAAAAAHDPAGDHRPAAAAGVVDGVGADPGRGAGHRKYGRGDRRDRRGVGSGRPVRGRRSGACRACRASGRRPAAVRPRPRPGGAGEQPAGR